MDALSRMYWATSYRISHLLSVMLFDVDAGEPARVRVGLVRVVECVAHRPVRNPLQHVRRTHTCAAPAHAVYLRDACRRQVQAPLLPVHNTRSTREVARVVGWNRARLLTAASLTTAPEGAPTASCWGQAGHMVDHGDMADHGRVTDDSSVAVWRLLTPATHRRPLGKHEHHSREQQQRRGASPFHTRALR